MSNETKSFESWAVLELLGHVRTAGKVSETEMFGTKMGRIDVPVGDGFVTQFFSGQSVYRLTPCGEAEARAVASDNQPRPVHPWEVSKMLPANDPAAEGPARSNYPDEDDDPDFDDGGDEPMP